MYRKKLLDSLCRVVLESELVGVSQEEISELEAVEAVNLPLVYKEFLAVAGSAKNRILVDNGFILYPGSVGCKARLLKEAEEEGELLGFPENSFLFKTFQEEEFWFFICNGDDDPEVMYIAWNEDEVESCGVRLSDFLGNTFDCIVQEGERAKKYYPMEVVKGYVEGLAQEKDLARAINDICDDIQTFQEPLVELVLVADLLRVLSMLGCSDLERDVMDLLNNFNVTDAQLSVALLNCKTDSGKDVLCKFRETLNKPKNR